MTRARRNLYQCFGGGLLRAAARRSSPEVPPWPQADGGFEAWRSWLATAWADAALAQAVTSASPSLAGRVCAIVDGKVSGSCGTRRARQAALSLGRYAIRSGCRSTPFGLFAGVAPLRFGEVTEVRLGGEHRRLSRLAPGPLDAFIAGREADPHVMADIRVCVSNLARICNGRAYVPAEGPAEYSLAVTPPVMLVMESAREPVKYAELVGQLVAAFPEAGREACVVLLTDLLRVGLLRSALRAPATVVHPAEAIPGVDAVGGLERQAVAIDLRLDADVQLPAAVALELETAATLLTRLTAHPSGTPAWRRYAERFAERYGDREVPVLELTDAERGLGYPDGFGSSSVPSEPLSARDRALMEVAGTAALEATIAVELSAPRIEALEAAAGKPMRPAAPHLELCAQILAPSRRALDLGRFRVWVQGASRGAGTMTGRFWHVVDPEDLVVGMVDGRLYLASRATGEPVELLAPTAINFVWQHHTPPMARFLAEICRADCPQVTGFAWGAALALPFTPALHYRRTVLTPARWRLRSKQLPGRTASLEAWSENLHAWRERCRMPSRVLLAEADQHLLLDLNDKLHLDILRTHLLRVDYAMLMEAPEPEGYGWIEGRAHSLVVPMRARP